MWDRLFKLTEQRTTVRTELLAGLTTFLTMSYILFVQPAVLSRDFAGQPTGLDPGAVLLATCVASALASIVMGLYAQYPIALAPGMGENFFFVSVIMALAARGVANAWQVALGIVLISGVICVIVSALRVREAIIHSISPSMRSGMAVGIGLFIALIGMQKGGLVVARPGTMIGLNTHFLCADVAVFLLGLLVASGLQARRVRGAILFGIGAAAVLAACLGKVAFAGAFGLPRIEHSAIMKIDLRGTFSLTCLPFIIVFAFMDLFDTVGTLAGVAEQAGFVKDNRLPRASRVLVADSSATVLGACMGTSSVTSYIESAAGVAYGGRTGLTAVAVGVLFLAALLFSPLIGVVANYPPITACAMVLVGAMMLGTARNIEWHDFSESIPAFLIAVGIPFTYSIADGLAFGFITYPLIKLVGGKGRSVSWLTYLLGAILLLYFVVVRIRVA
jgi:AGZA family xanthine/uracil permease-like MFS transporter